ncbi:hypothetical protein D1AOALGA4SA_2093 [Olavius algarvensis Delta 1 endosymbiont]|nr:hypothetical protein D1AOALGA4SA_2093 [Olavius algarvensis Delta 1 endosymbiont]
MNSEPQNGRISNRVPVPKAVRPNPEPLILGTNELKTYEPRTSEPMNPGPLNL